MRIPRSVSGNELSHSLKVYGYQKTRQTDSHIRLTTLQGGEHHVTIPNHNPLRIGTLANILTEVARHFQISRDELVRKLLGAQAL